MTARRPSSSKAPFAGFAAGALLLVLFGCGGSGGGSKQTTSGTTGTTGTSGTTGDSVSTAVLNYPNVPGQAAITFLTGAGREANDRTAVVRRIALDDTNGTEETRLQGERRIVLNRYSSQILPLNVTSFGSSRLFTTFEFDVLRFEVQDVNGNPKTYASVSNLPVVLPAYIRTFPGRTTHVPFYLDQETITDHNGQAFFSVDRFNTINFRAEEQNSIRGQLADYVSFDISNMSAGNRPTLANGNAATRVFFSGDGYAIADGNPYNGQSVAFEPIVPGGQQDILIGRLSGPQTLPSAGTPSQTPGTYSMIQADPSDVSSLPRRIISLQGTWKEHFRQVKSQSGANVDVGYLANPGTFEAITIPGSEDGSRQDMIAISETIRTNSDGTRRAVISNAYFGYIDLDTNRFFLYPIKNLYPTDTGINLQGEVSGTIGGFTFAGGTGPSALRAGKFSFTTGAPSGFPSTGRFLVLRR
ncbi:MAG: hypothetical protein C4320_05780 [Armatimonadota bacterium]